MPIWGTLSSRWLPLPSFTIRDTVRTLFTWLISALTLLHVTPPLLWLQSDERYTRIRSINSVTRSQRGRHYTNIIDVNEVSDDTIWWPCKLTLLRTFTSRIMFYLPNNDNKLKICRDGQSVMVGVKCLLRQQRVHHGPNLRSWRVGTPSLRRMVDGRLF